MLVLSRQRDETIVLDFRKATDEEFAKLKAGELVECTVVDIRGDKVRLGITAPKSIAVHRQEVYEDIQREERAAAQVDAAKAGGL